MPLAISLMSGGMDSVTLAYYLKAQGYNLHLLSFDYGQRHKKELKAAERNSLNLYSEWDLIKLRVDPQAAPGEHKPDLPLAAVLKGSSLTDEKVEVPHGHYAEESMKATVVPNRNAIMLSIAYGVAVAEKAQVVAFAAHSGDHAIYPDCRPLFVGALDDALHLGNQWEDEDVPQVVGPFLSKSKADIVTIGQGLGVPWTDTWTCYEGGNVHCGRCGTCVERKEAFQLARVKDPTTYTDPEYLIKANA